MPGGVLLVDPTGVGETLLATAVAGEAREPFLSISEFVGAARGRDLFRQICEDPRHDLHR